MKFIRNLLGISIIVLVAAAFYVWKPATPDGQEAGQTEKLLLALDSIADRVPGLQAEIESLSQDIQKNAAAFKTYIPAASEETALSSSLESIDLSNASLDTIKQYLKQSSEYMKEIDAGELSQRLQSIIQKTEESEKK